MLRVWRRLFRSPSLLILLIAAALLTGCEAATAPQTTYVPQGSSARHIFALYNLIFILAVVVFVLVEGLLLYSVFRYRRRPDHGIPLQLHGHQRLEIAWTILPALLVLFLATMTFRTQAILIEPAQNPVRVTVVGHQWWWEFQYPDYEFATANELHLPANRPIEFSLQSADVIHSFWFPRLAGKTDAIPGHTNKFTFTADDTAEPLLIRGQCAEYCGGTHAQMGMYAVVEPQAQFDAWVRAQQAEATLPAGVTQAATAAPAATAPAATAPAAPATAATAAATAAPAAATGGGLEARGHELFRTKGCIGCHVIRGYPEAVGVVGPTLTHVGSRQHIVAGWLENTPDNMRTWLRDPHDVKPYNIMAGAIKRGDLSEDEIEALTAYLLSLK